MKKDKAKRMIRTVEVSGSPYDIGFQYGSAAAEEIKKALDWWLVWSEIERTTAISLMHKLIPFTAAYTPDFFEVIRGMAKGAKLEPEEIFFTIVWDPIRASLKTGVAGMGCTSFAATGEATIDGETITGQTYDADSDLEDKMVLVKVRPKEGPSFMGITHELLPYVGINSAGLGIFANGLFYKEHHVPPAYGWVPWAAIQFKVFMSTNVSEAIGTIATARRTPPPCSLNVVIASREGDIVDVESTWSDFNVLYPERGVFTHSNAFKTERFKAIDVVATTGPDAYIRSHRLATLMTKHYGKLSVDLMKELLQDHNNWPNSICRHVDKTVTRVGQTGLAKLRTSKTLVAVVSSPKQQKMYMTLGNPCENEYIEYKL